MAMFLGCWRICVVCLSLELVGLSPNTFNNLKSATSPVCLPSEALAGHGLFCQRKEQSTQLHSKFSSDIYLAALSMGFSRQEYWSWFSCSSPGDLPNHRSNPRLPQCRKSLLRPFFKTPWHGSCVRNQIEPASVI